MPKPNDFQLGVVELFSIMLPGALLVAALLIAFGLPATFGDVLTSDAAAWVAFILASYAAGHLVFHLASQLDDLFYDSHRKATWPISRDHAYQAATALRRKELPSNPHIRDVPMNTFAWAKASLMFRSPAAYADVLRYEADSKFFRSLVVVLPIVGILLGFRNMIIAVPILSYLGYVCFFRYAERRYKSTEWAYRYVIVLSAQASDTTPSKGQIPMPIDETRTFLPLHIAVLTVSDTRTEADDRSGDTLVERLKGAGHFLAARTIVRDDVPMLVDQLSAWIDDPQIDCIITTGGTGVTGRDVTPEAFAQVWDKEIPGFGELFRWLSFQSIGTSTVQSRATAGVARGTYLFALPGSTGAVKDGWDGILASQLDSRHRPCNFVELMPRLTER